MATQILVIDDEPDIRGLLSDILADEGYVVGTAANATAGREQRHAQAWDLVLLDIWMPDTDGLSLLREWKDANELDIPVVMMSGHGTIETAVEATRLGAYDFIEKPISLAKLLITIERAIEAQRLRSDNQALRHALTPAHAPLGDSAAMRALRAQLERLAQHDAPVLLRGEAGTGKESLARWMHGVGPRRDQPFVTVAAGAIAEERAASTLFGEENDQGVIAGLLEHAEGGTLYLDEVAELSAELQLRLSSVLERREILRVGARQAIPLRARIIAASAKDLDAEVAAGRLRDALFYQLNVLPVSIPALRERPDDLPMEANALLQALAQRDRLPLRHFSLGAQTRLQAHSWPGNLRELRGLMQRLLVLGGEPEINALELDQALTGNRTISGSAVSSQGLQIDLNQPLREARDQFERAYLLHWLDESEGSVGKLAKATGMERTHLYRKLRDLGIDLRGARDN